MNRTCRRTAKGHGADATERVQVVAPSWHILCFTDVG